MAEAICASEWFSSTNTSTLVTVTGAETAGAAWVASAVAPLPAATRHASVARTAAGRCTRGRTFTRAPDGEDARRRWGSRARTRASGDPDPDPILFRYSPVRGRHDEVVGAPSACGRRGRCDDCCLLRPIVGTGGP